MATIRLTDRTLKGLSTERAQEEYLDELLDGFGVRVSGATGRKTFFVRYRVDGTRRRLTLGRYPVMSLTRARAKAKAKLLDVMDGNDPAAEPEPLETPTFAELADLYLERHALPNKAPASVAEDRRQLDKDLRPAWGPRLADEIDRADVLAVLDSIVDRGAGVMANRTLALVSRIFSFGVERGLIEHNPAYRVRRPTRERSRQRVLTAAELRRVWKATHAEAPLMGATFRLRLLTAQRGKEVLGMRHDHLDGAWWTIPAALSKTGEAHRVPLSEQALDVLAEIAALNRESDWIFPSARAAAGHISNVQKAAQSIRDASKVEFTPHDLRRTASTVMTSELGVSRFVVGKVLNHADRTTTAIYDRASYDPEKREALDAWGAHVEKIVTAEDDDD